MLRTTLSGQQHAQSDDFEARIKILVGKFRQNSLYPVVENSGTLAQALARTIRHQIARRAWLLTAASEEEACLWYGRISDCLSICGSVAHIGRENQLLLADILASGINHADLPEEYIFPRPVSLERTIEFLMRKEGDTPQDALSRLSAVNEALALLIEDMSDQELDQPVDTFLHGRRTLRDLFLIVIQQGAFLGGQGGALLKLVRSGM